MQGNAVMPADAGRIQTGQDRLRWGVVEFQVTDVARSTSFWCNVLGFVDRGKDGGGQALGTEDRTLVILHPGARGPVDRRAAGLYHVAFGVPHQIEFSRLLARLSHMRRPVSPVDHTMSKALYLSDPDGIGIEIALETPERFGRFSDMIGDFGVFDSDGHWRSGRDLLNVRSELAALPDDVDLGAPIAAGSCVAHLHFQVPGLESALSYFEGLGFARNLFLPHLGFADMSAGSAYTHRLAFNLWAGRNIRPASPDTSRLIRYTLEAETPPPGNGLRTDPIGIGMVCRPMATDRPG